MAKEWGPRRERPLLSKATRAWAATMTTVQRPTCARPAGTLWTRTARTNRCTSGRGADTCCIVPASRPCAG
eukprot:9146156-Lingulodinium_polyedra.AAC.1